MCRTDSAQTIMIFPAEHNANEISKQLFDEDNGVSSDDIHSEDIGDGEICGCTSDGDDEEERKQSVEMELKGTLLGLSPPSEKRSIMGKWYAGIYKMKKYSKLFVSRQLN